MRIALAGLAALAVAMGIGRFAFTPLLPMMQSDGGLSLAAGGWLAAANYLGYLFGALSAGFFPRSGRAIRVGLLAAGRSPQTPVGVFARVTRPDAQAVVGTLSELPDLIERVDGGPAILIIGDVVAHSAPWRRQNLNHVISELLEAAE